MSVLFWIVTFFAIANLVAQHIDKNTHSKTIRTVVIAIYICTILTVLHLIIIESKLDGIYSFANSIAYDILDKKLRGGL